MKVTAFVSAALVGAVSAFDFSDVEQFIASVPLKKSDVHHMHKAHKKIQLNEHQRANVQEAHHSVRATRERLGLSRVGAGPNVEQTYDNMNGFLGTLLGVAGGLMYHPGQRNACFTAVEGSLISLDSLAHVLMNIYMPWYWPEFQTVMQDEISLQAALYADCDVDKFFNTMTHLITWEGASELLARAAGGFFFEFQDLLTAWDDESISSYQLGTKFGRVFGTLTDWRI